MDGLCGKSIFYRKLHRSKRLFTRRRNTKGEEKKELNCNQLVTKSNWPQINHYQRTKRKKINQDIVMDMNQEGLKLKIREMEYIF